MKEMSRGLKKACALKAKKGKPVYNPLNDLKVTKNPTFKSFSESFYIYAVKTCRSLVRGFYFTAPVLPDSNVLHVSRKKTHPASFKHQAPTVNCDLCEHKTPLVLFSVTSMLSYLHSRVNK